MKFKVIIGFKSCLTEEDKITFTNPEELSEANNTTLAWNIITSAASAFPKKKIIPNPKIKLTTFENIWLMKLKNNSAFKFCKNEL